MDERTVEKFLCSLVEDYSRDELEDDEFMLEEMATMLKIPRAEARILLFGAREIKKLRPHSVPEWRQVLNMH